jgi:hypothetical protein
MAENENQEKTVDLSQMTPDELKDFIRREIVRIVFCKREGSVCINPQNKFQEGYLKKLVENEYAELKFRRAGLTQIARKQGETLVCPKCGTPVPNMPMTWFQKNLGDGSCKTWRYCTFCETEFKPS